MDDEGRRGKVKKPTKIRNEEQRSSGGHGFAMPLQGKSMCQMMGRGKELKEMQKL